MSNSVTVRAPARLHLGFLDPNGDAGRFGGIGLPLSEPETVVTLSRAGETTAAGPESRRAAEHLARLCRHLRIHARHRLVVEQAIPPHAGLGSGTQIALAVSTALRRLHGLPLDPDDALLLGRGVRSGIGIASFEAGGVIVDAGNGGDGRPPPVVARFAFPEEWRVILILDGVQAGLHGEAELEAFRSLPPFPRNGVGELCRLALMGAMPALAVRDIDAFGAAITAMQMLIGDHFAPAQGGVFTSKRVEAAAGKLVQAGATGIGQSSWGPTGFAFAPSEDAARAMVRFAQETVEAGIEIRMVKGRNAGADIASAGLDLVGS